MAARNVEETFVWVLRRRGGNAQQKGQTMDYRCKYCCVNFAGAGPQTMINMAGKRKRWEEAERQRKERGNGEEA